MEEGYWNLFWETGAPEFYLMKKETEKTGGEQEPGRSDDAAAPSCG